MSPRTTRRRAPRNPSSRQAQSDLDSEPRPGTDESAPEDSARAADDDELEPAPAPTEETEPAPVEAEPPELAASQRPVLARVQSATGARSSSDRASVAESAPDSASSTRITAFFALGAGFGVRVLPSLAPTFSATAGIQSDLWRAALHLGYAPPRAASLERPSGVGGRVSLSSAALDAGLRIVLPSLEVPLVAGLEAGFFAARGVGTYDTQLQTPLWLATYLGSGVRLHLSSIWAMALRLEGVVALRRPRFAVDDGQGPPAVFHRPALLGARALVVLEAHWR